MIQPFDAPNWLDLRVGFLLSLCGPVDPTDDDTITGLGETITTVFLQPEEHYWIGVKDSGAIMPSAAGSVFIGYTNAGGDVHNSELVTSDEGIGTTNANFWRPKSSISDNYSGTIFDGTAARVPRLDGIQQHFAQDASGAGGYATLLMFRLQRDDVSAHEKVITVTSKSGTHNGDVLYTDDPSKALLQSNLEAFPSTVRQWGPIALSAVPTALYLYWPFHDSRLRIHAAGILQAR